MNRIDGNGFCSAELSETFDAIETSVSAFCAKSELASTCAEIVDGSRVGLLFLTPP